MLVAFATLVNQIAPGRCQSFSNPILLSNITILEIRECICKNSTAMGEFRVSVTSMEHFCVEFACFPCASVGFL